LKLFNGDCLEFMETLDHSSVDLILCDLPYGLMKDIGKDDGRYTNGMLGKFDWDSSIDLDKFFLMSERLLRESGRLILFGVQPFTTNLINHSSYNLNFSYTMIWEKDHFANAFQAKRAPLNYFEDIIVFTKRYDTMNNNPLRQYFSWLQEHIGWSKAKLILEFGQRIDHTFRTESTQFKLCTEEAYNDLIERFNLENNEKFIPYKELKKINNKHLQTFNLKKGEKIKSNILKYPRDEEKIHPTQKPVDLLKDIIYSFTNKGDLVADFTMGSGSTGVAALELKRNFIGSELDPEFYEKAKERIDNIISR